MHLKKNISYYINIHKHRWKIHYFFKNPLDNKFKNEYSMNIFINIFIEYLEMFTMAKAFNENEIEIIRQKLIESCRICWERYGYRKTNVTQLCEMSGISTGAFYAFFSSKEMLFIATSTAFQEKLYIMLKENKPENPGKQDLANGLKLILEELARNKWVFSLHEDYEIFVRKLPDDFLEKDYQKDLLDISRIIEFYGLKPRVSMEEITAVVYTLYMSLYFTDTIGKFHLWAVSFLIDNTIDKLFE